MVEVAYKPLEPVGKTPPLSAFDVKFGKKFRTFRSTSSGSVDNIYTVPLGKVFVLLSAHMDYSNDNASGGGQYEFISSNPDAQYILSLHAKTPVAGVLGDGALALAFGDGVVFPSLTRFSSSNGGGFLTVGFAGYEIDQKYINFSP